MPKLGKFAIILGLLLVAVALVVVILNKSFPLGKLPGDITVVKENFKFYFPFSTSLVVGGIFSGLAALIAIIF